MKTSNINPALIKMLRQKQAKLGVYYPKTDGSFYKIFAVLFYILLAVCTVINIIYTLSAAANLSANLAYIDVPSALQTTEITAIKNSIYTVCVFGVLLIPSFIFLKKQNYVLHLIFTIIPVSVLITTYYSRMSDNLSSGTYMPFLLLHLLPLGLLVLCCIFTSAINLSQRIRDKKGADEIAQAIYIKHSALAENISEEQWLEILNEYEAPSKSKKCSVKHRLKKEAEQKETEMTEV